MGERDSRNQKELEEFVLVKNDKTPIFRETDVKVRPIAIGKNGPEFEVVDKEDKRIGIVKDDKTFEFDKDYREGLIKGMGKEMYEFLGFDKEKIKIDIMQKVKEQEERKLDETNSDIRKNEILENNKENKDINNDDKRINKDDEKTKGTNKIEKEELDELGYNITAWTLIKDQHVIDAMIPGEFDPRSIIVAEVEGEFKFLGREVGTGKIKELDERAGGNKQAEEVNKFERNVEKKEGRGTTMIMPDYGNMEFSIVKNGNGQIEVGRIEDLDGDGTREVIPIETEIIHPTMEEYRRAQYEKYGYEFEDEIMTGQEIDERLSEEEQSIRDEVKEDINSTEENPTREQLEEKIEDERNEQEQDTEEEKEEREEDDDEWVPWKPRSH